MLDAAVIDVALGLVLVYLTMGLVCTAISEGINAQLSLRSDNLRAAISNMLGDDTAAARFYDLPLIRTMRQKDRYPSYISPTVFSSAILDMLDPASPPRSVEELRLALRTSTALPERARRAMLSVIDADVTDLAVARSRIEGWFNHTMERASGWYRRRIQGWTLLSATLLVVSLDVDTIEIAQATWTDDALRASLSQRAERLSDEAGLGGRQIRLQAEDLSREVAAMRSARMPLGWSQADLERLGAHPEATWSSIALGWLSKVFGLAASGLAVSLGAPFWFDLLQRMVRVRTEVTARADGSTPQ